MTDPTNQQPPLTTGATISSGQFDSGGGQQVFGGVGIDQRGATIISEEAAYDVAGLPNPYRGLASYGYEDRASFAGRERYVFEATNLLTDPAAARPLMFVTGASGSGKSSFAMAGLLPALEKYYQQRGLEFRWAVFRPGPNPRAAFADALVRLGLMTGLASDLQQQTPDADAICRLLVEKADKGKVSVLVVDQFEELFTQADEEKRKLLLTLLTQLPTFAESHLHVIPTIRADYLPTLLNQPGFNPAQVAIYLQVMTLDELKAAIQQPLVACSQRGSPYASKRFEPDLLNRLATDAAADATYLPLLQVTLEDIWRGGTLKLGRYSDLTTALRDRANDVLHYRDYAGIKQQPRTEAEQQQIMDIMLDLVRVDDYEVQREVRSQEYLNDLTGGSEEKRRLVEQLSEARLLSTEQDTPTSEVEVNIIHETLIRNWPELQAAIREKRQQLARRTRFYRALTDWNDHSQSTDYLLTGVRLAEAQALAEAQDVALNDASGLDFLQASVTAAEAEQQRQLKLAQDAATAAQQATAAAEREKLAAEKAASAARMITRRTRVAIGVVSVLLVVAVLASLFAFDQRGKAQAAAEEAQDNFIRSEASRLYIAASNELERSPDASLWIAYRSNQFRFDPDTNDLIRRAVQGANRYQQSIFRFNAQGDEPLTAPLFSAAGRLFSPVRVVVQGGATGVAHIAVSPDKRYIVITLNGGTPLLADAEGNMLARLDGAMYDPSPEVLPAKAAFSTDSKLVQAVFKDEQGRQVVLHWPLNNVPTAEQADKPRVRDLTDIDPQVAASPVSTATNILTSPLGGLSYEGGTIALSYGALGTTPAMTEPTTLGGGASDATFSVTGRRILVVQNGKVQQYFMDDNDLLRAAACKINTLTSDERIMRRAERLSIYNDGNDTFAEQPKCPPDFRWEDQ